MGKEAGCALLFSPAIQHKFPSMAVQWILALLGKTWYLSCIQHMHHYCPENLRCPAFLISACQIFAGMLFNEQQHFGSCWSRLARRISQKKIFKRKHSLWRWKGGNNSRSLTNNENSTMYRKCLRNPPCSSNKGCTFTWAVCGEYFVTYLQAWRKIRHTWLPSTLTRMPRYIAPCCFRIRRSTSYADLIKDPWPRVFGPPLLEGGFSFGAHTAMKLGTTLINQRNVAKILAFGFYPSKSSTVLQRTMPLSMFRLPCGRQKEDMTWDLLASCKLSLSELSLSLPVLKFRTSRTLSQRGKSSSRFLLSLSISLLPLFFANEIFSQLPFRRTRFSYKYQSVKDIGIPGYCKWWTQRSRENLDWKRRSWFWERPMLERHVWC